MAHHEIYNMAQYGLSDRDMAEIRRANEYLGHTITSLRQSIEQIDAGVDECNLPGVLDLIASSETGCRNAMSSAGYLYARGDISRELYNSVVEESIGASSSIGRAILRAQSCRCVRRR